MGAGERHSTWLFARLSIADHQRFCVAANLFQDAFELLQLLRGEGSKDFFHVRYVLLKDGNDHLFAGRGERYDPDAAIVDAFNSANQSFGVETVNRHTNRSWSQIHFRSDRIDGKGAFVQEHLKNPKI